MGYFKAHPRKMRIESTSLPRWERFHSQFQSASSKNEDWKWELGAFQWKQSPISKRILEKWGLKACDQRRDIKRKKNFKAHPRKMRIESNLSDLWRRVFSNFKAHPRKMRIESSVLPFLVWDCLQFQSASSKNEDWKLQFAFRLNLMENIFQSASSKNEDWKRACAADYLNVLRFQSASSKNEDWKIGNNTVFGNGCAISKRILEKWGLKD